MNPHADTTSGSKGLKFGLSLHLYPYSVYASSKGSEESAHLCTLAWTLFAPQWDKYQNRMCLLWVMPGGVTFPNSTMQFSEIRGKEIFFHFICYSKKKRYLITWIQKNCGKEVYFQFKLWKRSSFESGSWFFWHKSGDLGTFWMYCFLSSFSKILVWWQCFHLWITFAKSLDPDQTQQIVSPDPDPQIRRFLWLICMLSEWLTSMLFH